MRTQLEIYTELTTNFVNNATIQQRYGLVPGQTFDEQFSKVSLEATLFHVVSYSIWILEGLFGKHVAWINRRAAEIRTGNTAWYARQALNYQHGDALVWDSEKEVYEYANIDESLRLVKFAKAIDAGSVFMKVAKEGANSPEKLTPSELASFTAYMQRVKFAGVQLDIVSRDADDLKISYKIFYDPLVLNADGSLISNPSVFPVEDAINSYNADLPFDARFNVTELTDRLQSTEGVVNPIFESAEGRSGAQAYAPITDYYESNAGYMRVDPAFPLSSTITYTPSL